MAKPSRTTAEINERVESGHAVIWTASNLLERRRGNVPAEEVDIVTIAFETSMSGTSAMLVVPVAGRGVFTRAEAIWLNGVRGAPGPAPNERLGLVDTMIMADDVCEDEAAHYDGAALLYDILKGEEISVDCVAVEGSRHSAKVKLGDLEFARFYVYNAFITSKLPQPVLTVLGRGSRILLNGAHGIIVGSGTRHDELRQSWSVAADMFKMDPGLMAGLDGTDRNGIGNMIAVPIPIRNKSVLDGLVKWTTSLPPVGPRESAAGQLRDMLLKGIFTLTDTDHAL